MFELNMASEIEEIHAGLPEPQDIEDRQQDRLPGPLPL
jgi:hypothetical protein